MVKLGRYVVPRLKFQGPLYDRLMLPFMTGRFGELEDEYLVEGPTGTGKSMGIGALYRHAMRKYPGCNLLVMRQVKADLAGSFMQMWEEEVLEADTDPWDAWMLDGGRGYIPSHRSRITYEYPNGSKLWCLGMNNWARFKSKAFDLIWPMEMTEFTEEQIEGLHTRLRARAGSPFGKRILIGDVNPEHPGHWANQRANDGTSHRICTTLRDNPGYYDLNRRAYTVDGQDYLDRINKTIRDPVRRSKYLDGIWTQAAGQILKFDGARNLFRGHVEALPGKEWRLVIDGPTHPILGDFVTLRGFGASYDWGSAHAGTLQVWGMDDAGRQYLVEEVYHSRRPHSWWAEWAVKFWKKYDLQFIVCDGAGNGAHQVFNQRLREEGGPNAGIAQLCSKRVGSRQQTNLEVLVDLFEDQPDGNPGVYMNRLSLAHMTDAELGNKPKCLAEEIPQYVYARYEESANKGRPADRPENGVVDDGLDACTYFRAHVLGGRKLARRVPDAKRTDNVYERMDEMYWKDSA